MNELRRIIWIIFIIGFSLNFIYESVQMELFFDFPSGRWLLFAVIHVMATLGDVSYIFLIYLVVAALARNLRWFCQLNVLKVVATMLAGFIIAVTIEKRALLSGRWSYGPMMPIIPYLGVGLTPVLQMTLLPLTTFLISRKVLTTTHSSEEHSDPGGTTKA